MSPPDLQSLTLGGCGPDRKRREGFLPRSDRPVQDSQICGLCERISLDGKRKGAKVQTSGKLLELFSRSESGLML